uniref:Secreted protein n=1 Tax=Schistosoma curassoni TaxID=6186 RepID=A0A183JQM1_9TREM
IKRFLLISCFGLQSASFKSCLSLSSSNFFSSTTPTVLFDRIGGENRFLFAFALSPKLNKLPKPEEGHSFERITPASVVSVF